MIIVEFGRTAEWKDRVVARSEREATIIAGAMVASWSPHDLGKAPFTRRFWFGSLPPSGHIGWSNGINWATMIFEEE